MLHPVCSIQTKTVMLQLKVVNLQGVYVLELLYFWQTAFSDIDFLESQDLFTLYLWYRHDSCNDNVSPKRSISSF